MNLSVVRLCFQAYLPDEKGFFRHALEPVFGQKVYDSSECARTHTHTHTHNTFILQTVESLLTVVIPLNIPCGVNGHAYIHILTRMQIV